MAGEGHSVASGDLAVLHADPGQTATATFMMDEPGTYDIAASPPHREAGMVAVLTVVENS